VRTWDREGNVSPWSEPARFDGGLPESGFSAQFVWDGTENVNDYAYFRKGFTLPFETARAKVYLSAHDTGTCPQRSQPVWPVQRLGRH